MPLLQRQIQPRYLGRQQLDESVRTDLQATFVNSLSGVMRQLGSLSKHAEDLLSQVVGEIQKVKRKADSLNSRIERAAQRVLQLNPLEEQVRIDDIGTQQHFRSHSGYSKEQAFDALELPSGVLELYNTCPPNPRLSDFDQYREDQKKSMKHYSDPSYFFALWLAEQKMMMEKTAVKKKRRKKKTRDARTEDIKLPTRKVYKTELDILNEPLTQEEAYANAFSNHVLSPPSGRHSTKTCKSKDTAATTESLYENVSKSRTASQGYATLPSPRHHRPSVSPTEKQLTPPLHSPPPPPTPVAVRPAASHNQPPRTTYSPQAGQHATEVPQTQLTPAPAPARIVTKYPKNDAQTVSLPSTSVPKLFSQPDPSSWPLAAPPPPPPPPPAITADTPVSVVDIDPKWEQTHLHHPSPVSTHPPMHQPPAGTINSNPPPPAPPTAPAPPQVIPQTNDTPSLEINSPSAIKVAAVEPKNDLLDAIRQGKKLRTVEPLTVPKTIEFQGMDVASILARRVAFVSDSESELDEGSFDEEEWSD